MPTFVFDTDSLPLFQRGQAQIGERFLSTPPRSRAVAVISVEEQLTGWMALVRRARTNAQLAVAYQSLTDTVSFLATVRVLSFTEPAIERYHALRAMKLGVGTMDLRIAAIALEEAATVVTRNLRDFRRVPGLACENWAD